MKGFRLDRPADRWCLGCGLVLVLSLLLSDTVLRAYVALTDAHPLCGGILQVRVARNVRGKPCAADAGRALPAASFRPRVPARWHGAFSVYVSRWRS